MSAMRKEALAAVVTAAALVAGCGGGGSNPVAPVVTQPPAPTQANITVTQAGTAFLCLSPRPDTFFRVQFTVTLRESAGLGANMNFVRVSFLKGSVEAERQEIGANAIVAGLGSNRVAASSERNISMRFDYNSGPSDFDHVALLFDFTHDRGNHLNAQLGGLANIVTQTACPAS